MLPVTRRMPDARTARASRVMSAARERRIAAADEVQRAVDDAGAGRLADGGDGGVHPLVARSSDSAATAVTSFSFEAGMRGCVPLNSYTGVPSRRTTETGRMPLSPLAAMNFARVLGDAACAGDAAPRSRDERGERWRAAA